MLVMISLHLDIKLVTDILAEIEMVGVDIEASMSTAVDMAPDTDHDYQEVTSPSSSCLKNNVDALTLKVLKMKNA